MYLRGAAGVGAPGELGHAEAKHGYHVDVDAAIAQRGHRPVHGFSMLCGHIWWHLHLYDAITASVMTPMQSDLLQLPDLMYALRSSRQL